MSKLRINTRSNLNVTILDLSGELTAGYGARTLSRKLRRLEMNSQHHILLNFTRVTGLDEAGMKTLANCLQNRVAADRHVKLFGVDERPGKMTTELLTLTHLLTSFDVFNDEKTAISSFNEQDLDRLTRQLIRRNTSLGECP